MNIVARSRPTTPRQKIFTELEELLSHSRDLMADPGSDNFEVLESVVHLARRTAQVLKVYQVKRDLLLQIFSFLAGTAFDFKTLDANWDGQGQLPSREFQLDIGHIAVAVSGRIPADGSMIEHPLSGERTTCAELRDVFQAMGEALGVQQVVQAFAA